MAGVESAGRFRSGPIRSRWIPFIGLVRGPVGAGASPAYSSRMRVGKLLHKALVWLAVLATPVAAAPRAACVCPGGKVQPGTGDCCLKDRGSPPTPASHLGSKNCCKSGHPSGGRLPTSVTTPQCHTILVDTVDAALNSQTTSPDDSAAATSVPHPFDQLSNPDLSLFETASFAQDRSDPPPTDRVVVYCHFVI